MYSKVKGTKDYNVVDYLVKDYVFNIFNQTILKFNYRLIETPIIENSNLFKRSVGEGSDIVNKEMYEFKDKGDREICLRPEGTAGFVRALVENKWYASENKKYAYVGPYFRYEQPQKGRYRQFWQAGVEFIGDKNYLKDAEVIYMAQVILNHLEVETELKINSIGDLETRKRYEEALVNYLKPYKSQLSLVSQERLTNGHALRILDDKLDSKLPFMANAPKISDYLSDASKKYLEQLIGKLNDYGVEYTLSNELVRGLDYYDEVVFEFVATDKNAGSQSTLIGGGRYSNLIEQIGGPKLSSIGFGFGVDRIMTIIYDKFVKENNLDDYVSSCTIYLAASENDENLDFMHNLANNYLRVFFDQVKNEYELIKSKKVFEKAQKYNASILIYDDKNVSNKMLVAKSLVNGEKCTFTKNEEGIIDLIRFIADQEVSDISVDQIEELLEGEFGYE
ncbi:histidine--tRNA ligase [Mycoplasma corogypsi]|uniref:histidine--tRNA ligase n=1 Tax=Mycoplasma corogypsi TaxID=2106 RepID=UPI0038739714